MNMEAAGFFKTFSKLLPDKRSLHSRNCYLISYHLHRTYLKGLHYKYFRHY